MAIITRLIDDKRVWAALQPFGWLNPNQIWLSWLKGKVSTLKKMDDKLCIYVATSRSIA